MIFQLVIALVGLSLTYIYVRTQKRMRLWSDMGVAEDPGTFPLGNAVGYTKACSNQAGFFCAFRGKLDFAKKPQTRFFPLRLDFFPIKLDFPAILSKFYITKYNLT